MTDILEAGRNYLLTIHTRRPLERSVLEKALGKAIGDVLVEVPCHEGDMFGRGGGGGGRGGGGRAAPMRATSFRLPRAMPGRAPGVTPSPGAIPGKPRRFPRGFGPGFGPWWWGGPSEVIVEEEDYPLVVVDEDEGAEELAGALLQRARIAARPSQKIALKGGENVAWEPSVPLSISLFTSPHVASSGSLLAQGTAYDLRLLSPLKTRKLARYLQAIGFDLDELPARVRPCVRVSSNFPPLSEYVTKARWIGITRSLEPISPGFIIEEIAPSVTMTPAVTRAAG